MRHVRGIFWSLLAAGSLSAAPLVAMAQDGLQRFQCDVKPQLPFQAFTYAGVSAKASMLDSSKDDVRLRTSTLVLDDSGLLAKLLRVMAKQNGAAAEMWVAMALASLGGFANGQGPESMKAFDALASYIGDWKAPKGPLRIALKPPKTTSLDDVAKIAEPNALTDIFGLTAA